MYNNIPSGMGLSIAIQNDIKYCKFVFRSGRSLPGIGQRDAQNMSCREAQISSLS